MGPFLILNILSSSAQMSEISFVDINSFQSLKIYLRRNPITKTYTLFNRFGFLKILMNVCGIKTLKDLRKPIPEECPANTQSQNIKTGTSDEGKQILQWKKTEGYNQKAYFTSLLMCFY